MVPVVIRSVRETWRMVLRSRSTARWAMVFSSSTEKLVRRLSPRVLARPRRSVMERDFSRTLSLMPMRIFC